MWLWWLLLCGLARAQEECLCHNAVGEACELCVPGTARVAEACERCALGTYQPTYGEPCLLCQAGAYASHLGSTACQTCEAGKFAAGEGSARCETCPDGSSSALDATSCVCALTKGKGRQKDKLPIYASGSLACLPCGPDQVVPSFLREDGVCVECSPPPDGYFAGEVCGATTDAQWVPCTACEAYTVRPCTPFGGDAQCLRLCDAGTEVLVGAQCACAAGHRRLEGAEAYGWLEGRQLLGGACEPCAAGTYLADNQCQACGGLRGFSAAPASTACSVCSDSELVLPNRTGCTSQCVDNHVLQWEDRCEPCPPLTVASQDGLSCVAPSLEEMPFTTNC